MSIKSYIYIATLAILTSCSDDMTSPTYTVGEAINAITLRAGINEGGEGVHTRAGAEDHHTTPGHVNFTDGTKLRLRVDGTWTGHAPEAVSKTTTATTGDKTGRDNWHNVVNFEEAEEIYWDDYGTADPANASTGRTTGLTIYGVAINGETTAPTVSNWTALAWALSADQSTGSVWGKEDLLISNNIRVAPGGDSTYKFDDYVYDLKNDPDRSSNLLEFRHAMSMFTIKLTAGKGFDEGKFVKEPMVVLHGFPTSGTVNVTTSALSNAGTVTDVTTFRSTADWASTDKVDRYALVFPTRDIYSIGTGDDDYIAKINADDNIYYVTKDKLLAAMGSNTTMESGKNYILNITVDKTEIHVTATIADWIDVEAVAETPKINVTANVGEVTVDNDTKERMPSFDFYLSDVAGANATTAYAKFATATKPSEGADGATVWGFDNNLYWPNHKTHYYMRGVSPTTTTVTTGKIDVTAGDFNSVTSPSNLLVGAPVIADNTMCGNPDHTQVDMSTGGICAREGKINLTFNYMMSQVEVRLTTAASGDSKVNLTKSKVEIVGGYTTGQVDIHTKTVATTGDKAAFTVNHVDGEDDNYRHSIVVPQTFAYSAPRAEGNLRFKITIYKNGDPEQGVDDIYYTDIYPIKKKDSEDLVAPNHKWESGVHYIYNLYIEKTSIKVTATIKDWIPIEASDNVWF